MVLDKKTKRDVTGIVALGTGLGIGTAIESKLAPPVAVFPTVAPIAAVAGPVVGAGILLRQVKKLPTADKPVQIKSLSKAKAVIKATKQRSFL